MGKRGTCPTFPDYTARQVNDYAEILTVDERAELTTTLKKLRNDTGVQMVIVTMATKAEFTNGRSLERFANRLFERWRIGGPQRRDGVLVLVLQDDREMRIELGLAYGQDWNRTAQRVVDRHFIPAFKSGNFARGIRSGTDAVIEDIVLPFARGEEPAVQNRPSDRESGAFWPVILIFGFIAYKVLAPVFRWFLIYFKACPTCGARTLQQTSVTIDEPTATLAGKGQQHIWCKTCDYDEKKAYVIPIQSDHDGHAFGGRSFGGGGGSSGGGGASGRW